MRVTNGLWWGVGLLASRRQFPNDIIACGFSLLVFLCVTLTASLSTRERPHLVWTKTVVPFRDHSQNYGGPSRDYQNDNGKGIQSFAGWLPHKLCHWLYKGWVEMSMFTRILSLSNLPIRIEGYGMLNPQMLSDQNQP
jgi:hypothetical protein